MRLATEMAQVVDDGDNLHDHCPRHARPNRRHIVKLRCSYLRGIDLAIINSNSLEEYSDSQFPEIRQA